jgi:hypothetical protein
VALGGGAATHVDSIFGGASRVPSHDFLGQSPRFDLHWLYLAIVLLRALF